MRWNVKPGTRVRLASYDPDDTGDLTKGEPAERDLADDLGKLAVLQERLYAENRRSVLIVLQAMDTGGKDGTIKHVFSGLNPSSCGVTNFKVPSAEERAHDFLWRIHRACPRDGAIQIFNRSHYEDVLVPRVHRLVPKAVWRARYDQINSFEAGLVAEGTTVLKFFLHISKREQKKRLQARLDDPTKRWKFSRADLAERKFWTRYQEAYEDAITHTSTEIAPWTIVPANHKWYRNLVVARTIVKTIEKLAPEIPSPDLDVAKIRL